MSQVTDWFFGWAERHIMRCSAAGRNSAWPEIRQGMPTQEATNFFGPWVQKFIAHGVTHEAAEEASLRMAEGEHVPYPGPKHLDVLMGHVAKAWEVLRARERGVGSGTREEAQFVSKGCPECSGDGYAARWRVVPERGRFSTAFFCLCPHGEWLAQYFLANHKDSFNRIRRLAQYPELWNPELSHRSWPALPEPRQWAMESWWERPAPVDVYAYTPQFERGKLKGIGIRVESYPADY